MALNPREDWPAFLLALQFLTRLPVRAVAFSEAAQAASPRWYPAVGAVLGALGGLALLLAGLIWPAPLAALVAVAVVVLATGALHEDGMADLCDGLGGGRAKERALEIMRDSRIGAYGAIGLALMLAGRVAALAALPLWAAPWVLIAAEAASRGAMLWVMQVDPYLRAQGAGSGLTQKLNASGRQVAIATLAMAGLPLLLALPLHGLALAYLGAGLGAWALRRHIHARLGGYTGDCLGAVQQVALMGFLLGALAFS